MSLTQTFGGIRRSLIGLVKYYRSMELNSMLLMSMGLVNNAQYAITNTKTVESREDYICQATGIKINADLNAARNIAKRVGYEVPIPRKILSYMVTSNGVKPLTSREGVTVETSTVETPP